MAAAADPMNIGEPKHAFSGWGYGCECSKCIGFTAIRQMTAPLCCALRLRVINRRIGVPVDADTQVMP